VPAASRAIVPRSGTVAGLPALRTHQAAGLNTTLILLAAPKAQTFYPHIGMTKYDSCWTISRQDPNQG